MDTFKHSWQPIDTAPMDGTLVLVTMWGQCEIAAWLPYHDASYPYLWQTQNGSPLYQPWKHESDDYEKPTHWMPLPEIPEEAK